ncbi:unnamed protein product, partial [Rotaria magnacalcarata]
MDDLDFAIKLSLRIDGLVT